MAGGRALAGVAAGAGSGAGSGAGVPRLLGLLVVMEAGVPVPVPSDLVMLLLGERVSAGVLPLWLAKVESRFGSSSGSGAGLPALVTGRTTPGLRTVTVVMARRRRSRVARILAEGACPAALGLSRAAPR